MGASVSGIHLSGNHAGRPGATTVPDGSLYACTDHGLIYKSDYAGNSWSTWATLGTSGGYSPGGTDVAVSDGGTGASTASGARTNLGLVIGTDVQAAGAYSPGGTDVAVTDGGTGASTASTARSNLGISATNTPITDSGNYFTGTDVEAALQELGAGVGGGGSDLDAIITASSGQDIADALAGAAAPDASNVFATMADVGGGGGLSQSYLGYNTVGGTWTTCTAFRMLCKQVTFSTTTTLVSIDAYLRPSTDNLTTSVAMLMADNAGAPGVLRAGTMTAQANTLYLSNSSSMPGAGRWFSWPVTGTFPSGTYWIAFGVGHAYFDIANDGSGSDQYFNPGTMYVTGAYPSAWAITTGSVKYSIRASILS